MDIPTILFVLTCMAMFSVCIYLFWHQMVMYNASPVKSPEGDNIVSPVDGRIQFIHRIAPDSPDGKRRRIPEAVGPVGDESEPSLLHIGLKMSVLGARYHRAPMSGEVEDTYHFPCGQKSGAESRETAVLNAENGPGSCSKLITRITGSLKNKSFSCHLIHPVNPVREDLHSFVRKGSRLRKGGILAVNRTPGHIELLIPWVDGLDLKAVPGSRVRAGKTILVG